MRLNVYRLLLLPILGCCFDVFFCVAGVFFGHKINVILLLQLLTRLFCDVGVVFAWAITEKLNILDDRNLLLDFFSCNLEDRTRRPNR